MTYYLIRYHHKDGANGVFNSVFKSAGEAADHIEALQKIDAERGDMFDWLYNIVVVKTVEEYPVEEWRVAK